MNNIHWCRNIPNIFCYLILISTKFQLIFTVEKNRTFMLPDGIYKNRPLLCNGHIFTSKTHIHEKIISKTFFNLFVGVFVNTLQFWCLMYIWKMYPTLYVIFLIFNWTIKWWNFPVFMLALLVIFISLSNSMAQEKQPTLYFVSFYFQKTFQWTLTNDKYCTHLCYQMLYL